MFLNLTVATKRLTVTLYLETLLKDASWDTIIRESPWYFDEGTSFLLSFSCHIYSCKDVRPFQNSISTLTNPKHTTVSTLMLQVNMTFVHVNVKGYLDTRQSAGRLRVLLGAQTLQPDSQSLNSSSASISVTDLRQII